MPTYEYRCENGHLFEVFRSMTDDPVTACEVCGAPVQRVFHAPAVHFKGSGFYTTDYKKKVAKSGEAGSKSEGGDSDSKSSDSDSGSKSESKSKSKSESKSKDSD